MSFYRVVWRDQERNRVIEIFVDYRVSDAGVEIMKLRPTRVMLLSESGEAVRQVIHVRTQAGQRFLAKQFEQRCDKVSTLASEIHTRHHGRDEQAFELPLAV